jgi:hypothetical protein
LHPDDPLRAGYDAGGPPPPRTHEAACREAKESEASLYSWESKANHPRYKTGINHWSPLSVISRFNMIWDFCPDMMHIIKTFFERLVVGVFTGERAPSLNIREPAKMPKNPDIDARKKYREAKKEYDDLSEEHETAVASVQACTFSEMDKRVVDARVKNLVGYPNWIRTSLVQRAFFSLCLP